MQALCNWTIRFGPVIGRVLLANIFLVSGARKLTDFSASAAYMISKMAGLPVDVIHVLLVLTIILELGGGLMILLGWQARWGATAIFLWMIPVTLLFHAYWAVPPDQLQLQFIMFQKNLAIMGGLLFVMAFGSGSYSLGKNQR